MSLRQAALVLLAGCTGSELGEPREPEASTVVFTVHEAGGDLDIDGYELLIDGRPVRQLMSGQPLTLRDLPVGSHDAELRDIEPNCTARSGTTARFIVVAGGEASVEFTMDCVVTGVLITLAPAGIDGAPEYPVMVDGVLREWIRPGLGTRITRLQAGSREIGFGPMPANCALAEPQKKTITLAPGSLEPVSFAVTCLATTGVLRIHGETHGEDVDPNGYKLNIDTSTGREIGALGDRSATLLIPAGAHVVALDGVAWNCSVQESAVRSIEIAGGGLARDTVDLSFEIRCQRAYRLAFTRGERIALSDEDGSHVELAKVGQFPVWSPDGRTLAYACGFAICRLGLDGARLQSLPATGAVRGIAWSHDGNRLAYVFDCASTSQDCQGGLALVTLDGSPETRITLPASVRNLHGVSWSPDGSRLAFGCSAFSGFHKICTVGLDGSNFVRLAPDGAMDPAWSPDGTRILFTQWDGEYTPYVMNADGSGRTRLSLELRGRSGGWINNDSVLISEMSCDGYYGCWSLGISSMQVDGSARVRLSLGPDREPVWRP